MVFRNVERYNCRFEGGSFAGVQITEADVGWTRIGGVLVTERTEAYAARRRAP